MLKTMCLKSSCAVKLKTEAIKSPLVDLVRSLAAAVCAECREGILTQTDSLFET